MHKMRYVCAVLLILTVSLITWFGTLCFIRRKGTPHWRGPLAGAILQAC
jgi:hypothetical protein